MTIVYVYEYATDYSNQRRSNADALVCFTPFSKVRIEKCLEACNPVLALVKAGFTFTKVIDEGDAIVYHVYGSSFKAQETNERFTVFKYPDSHTDELKVRFVQVTDKDNRYIKGIEDGQFKNFLRSKIVKVEVIPV